MGAFVVTTAMAATGFAAHQPARGSVLLDVNFCPDAPEAAIRRIMAIEIGDLLLEPGAAPPGDVDRLSVRCAGGSSAWIQARAAAGAPIERTLRVTDFPGDAAPRALALAGIEMLAALSPAVRERIQIRDAPAAPTRAGGRMALSASAVRRDFFATGGFGGWGGRLDLDRPFGARSVATVDLEVDGGRQSIALGDAGALLVSLGGFWGLRAAGTRVMGSLSVGARVGLARLEGTPAGDSGAVGGRALRPWWGPAIGARGVLGRGSIGLVVSVETGIVARGAQGLAGGATVLSVDGAWVTAGAGLRF
jgi:hypothetical protein